MKRRIIINATIYGLLTASSLSIRAVPEIEISDALDSHLGLDEATLQQISQPPGRIQFSKTVHDLGFVYRGQVLEISFPFQNTGKGPLRIQGVHASCGCTVVSLPQGQGIEPGSGGEIGIVVDTSDYSGDFSRTVAVMTSDASQRTHVLTLKAHIRSEIDIDPPIIDFGGVAAKTGSHRTIRLKSAISGKPLNIKRIEHNPEFFDIALRQVEDEWWIEVFLRAGLPTSFISDSLVIINDSKYLENLPVPLRADILGKIRYEPNYVEFGAIPYQGATEKTIVLSSQQAFQVKDHRAEVRVNGQLVEDFREYFEFLEQTGSVPNSRLLGVRLKNPNQLSGSVHGRLIFETSDPGQEEVTINFYAFFQE